MFHEPAEEEMMDWLSRDSIAEFLEANSDTEGFLDPDAVIHAVTEFLKELAGTSPALHVASVQEAADVLYTKLSTMADPGCCYMDGDED
jgi:hypothetical protein